MFKPKPPFKLALAASLLDAQPRSAEEIFQSLRDDYTGEKICTLANVDAALQSLKSVGILSAETVNDDIFYALSAHGREKVKANLRQA